MTKKEVSINTTWDEFEMGTFRLFVEALDQYIPVLLFQDHKPKPRVSEKMMDSINGILKMDITEFDRLSEVVGSRCKIKEIHIDQENDQYDGVYSEVIVTTDDNKQVTVVVKDSLFLCINEGAYFDTLEVSKQSSEVKKPSAAQRQQVIDMMLSS